MSSRAYAQAVRERGTRVEEGTGLGALSRFEEEWDALARCRPETGPFALAGWTRVWMESFEPEGLLTVFRATHEGRPIAFAPLLEQRGQVAKVPMRLWRSPSNAHSLRVAWALDRDEPALGVRAVWERLRDKPWEALVLDDVVEGSVLDETLGAAAEEDGFLVARRDTLESPWLPVPPPGELDGTLASKFRANLRRRRRKLAKEGPLVLERVDGEVGLCAALERGFALEASGWKGRVGTAIASSPETRAFYTRLARLAASQGWLSLYTLSAGGRPVAFEYGLEYGGCYYLPKSGYAEDLSACSPGQLLVEDILRDLAVRGTAAFDFLGPQMTWKHDWTERIRPHVRLFVFRPTLKGRLLHAGRFRYGPALKRRMREVASWRR